MKSESNVHTILVTGSDTGIGKTRVAAAIGRLLWQPRLHLQFVKPVETGRLVDEPGDADAAREASDIETASRFTLLRFPLPLAPLSAAKAAGREISLASLLDKFRDLPPADLRIVEGAGGIAVPLDSNGCDWGDFAREIQADRLVLVVPDRLGGINQARLTFAYAKTRNLPAGLWLNENEPQPEEIRQSNREALATLPLWATQRFEALLPENPEETRRHLLLQ